MAGYNRSEVSAALLESRRLFAAVAIFSGFFNLLMLTGPLFMLQVYDRVLASRSIETLTALFGLATFMFAIMATLDLARSRVMSRAAARLQARLDNRVFTAALERAATNPDDTGANLALRDLEAMQKALAAPVVLSAMDLPWVPLYLVAIFAFHPLMGILAVVGGAALIVAAILQQQLTARSATLAQIAGRCADYTADQFRQEYVTLRSLGMQSAAVTRWHAARNQALRSGISVADTAFSINAFSRSFRVFLQSGLLALGAWLVIDGRLTGGAMFASSIILGRALAPIEGLISGWPLAARAIAGRKRLAAFLASTPIPAPRTPLPKPRAALVLHDLTVTPPGADLPCLHQISLRLEPGQILGVIGPSGAGKSTLVKAAAGAWAPVAGTVQLDGAALHQYAPDTLGRAIGYLPQRINLFDGTIAENIARLTPGADPSQVIRAARHAGAHEMIIALARGYDTAVSPLAGGSLSGGQMQRIGLARALFGDPALLILDEPDASLDGAGVFALVSAVRGHKSRGGSVILTAHHQTLLRECDMLLALDHGQCRALGPRDAVLQGLNRPARSLGPDTAKVRPIPSAEPDRGVA
jgi:ATP-binding cassette, subfamily C, bacterial